MFNSIWCILFYMLVVNCCCQVVFTHNALDILGHSLVGSVCVLSLPLRKKKERRKLSKFQEISVCKYCIKNNLLTVTLLVYKKLLYF